MKSATLLLVATINLTGCANMQKEKIVPGNESASITVSEVSALERKAESGDIEAAFKLYFYFDFQAADHGKALRFLKIAARGGHLKAMLALGTLLVESPNTQEKDEGYNWLIAAANAGSQEAKQILKLYQK